MVRRLSLNLNRSFSKPTRVSSGLMRLLSHRIATATLRKHMRVLTEIERDTSIALAKFCKEGRTLKCLSTKLP